MAWKRKEWVGIEFINMLFLSWNDYINLFFFNLNEIISEVFFFFSRGKFRKMRAFDKVSEGETNDSLDLLRTVKFTQRKTLTYELQNI